MRPLLKWPGGKSGELDHIRPLVPAHERYVEPFVGAGALLFDLEPASALINDVVAPLMDLYRMLGTRDAAFRRELRRMGRAWNATHALAARVRTATPDLVHLHDRERVARAVMRAGRRAVHEAEWAGIITGQHMNALAGAHVAAKLARIERAITAGTQWSAADIADQVETAVHGAFYAYVRDELTTRSRARQVAAFVFVREFCYGSMFRYNARGEFNIPYGGRSYNARDWDAKIEAMLAPEVAALLARSEIRCESFAAVLGDVRATDFVFLDPPYDTRFSAYGQHTFGRDEHAHLARLVAGSRGQVLMVIQANDFIRNLYRDAARTARRALVVEEYENTYQYSVRGRNDRRARHLLVRNYDPPR